jgi:hypothetical protein
MNLSSLTDPSDYLAGHLDKKVNEDSARGSLPVQVRPPVPRGGPRRGPDGCVRPRRRPAAAAKLRPPPVTLPCPITLRPPPQSWRWQRRFFIVSDSQRALFYFKSEGAGAGGGRRGTPARHNSARVESPCRRHTRARTRTHTHTHTHTRTHARTHTHIHAHTSCPPPPPPPAPDDVPKPNGLRARIDLGGCVVEDLDEAGNPRPTVRARACKCKCKCIRVGVFARACVRVRAYMRGCP